MTAAALGPALLFCPADRSDRFVKAAERADTVIYDLEDAVGPDGKGAARQELERFLAAEHPTAVVRINDAATPWHAVDLAMLRRVGHHSVMVPKVSGPQDLDGLEGFEVVALCETARGIVRSASIAEHPVCRALMWGGEDLVADLGGFRSRNGAGRYHSVVEQARSTTLLAAASAGKVAIDAVHIDIGDLDGLRRETDEAVDIGFDAKACIHPSHIETIREAFGVTAETQQWAQRVVDAASGATGVFQLDGQMIDEPLIRHARTVLQRAATAAK